MPSVIVHLRLAEQVLDHWRAHPGAAPFGTDDAAAVNAFRHGSVGPDLGFFPGGHRPLSDLSHTFRSGDLSRSLISRARTSLERAFAWGWVTHVLADTRIHPLIGCAVGELRYGSVRRFVDGDTDPVTHVGIESGLDAHQARRHPEVRRIRLHQVFDAHSIAYLVSAYRETYGVDFATADFLRSHRLTARRAMQGVGLAALIARTLPDAQEPGGRIPGPIRVLRGMLGRQCTALAFLLPAPPPLWLTDAVRDVEDAFTRLFLEEYAVGGATLANVNLDTGRPDLSEIGHGGLERSLALLNQLGSPHPRTELVARDPA